MQNYFNQLKGSFSEGDFRNHPEAIDIQLRWNWCTPGAMPTKICSSKGTKMVYYQTSSQKEQITVVGCVSGTGQYLPPFIIFAAKKLNHLWCRNEVTVCLQWKGMDRWRIIFFLSGKSLSWACSSLLYLMLMVDGHSTHNDLVSLKFAKDHKVTIIWLPPHTTHECQPLDCSLLKLLKDYWRQKCNKFYCKNPGSVIRAYSVFCQAWLSAITPANVIAGFRRTPSIVMPFLA